MDKLKGKSGIYVIRNIVNNKAYIGSAVDLYKRKCNHYSNSGVNDSHNEYLSNSFAKYGVDNMIFEVLAYVENKEELTTTETRYIQLFDVCNRDIGYNICKVGGSRLGIKHTEEARKRMRLTNKGKNRWLGKKHSEESRKKMSLSQSGENNPNWGKSLSDERKRKLSEAKLIPVVQLTLDGEFVAEFNSIIDAGEAIGILSTSHIGSVCRGKRNKCGGYKWMYASDYYTLKVREEQRIAV